MKIIWQLNEMDCGPACLRMIAEYYGKKYHLDTLRRLTGFNKEGVSLLGLTIAAEEIGLKATGAKLDYDRLMVVVQSPCILHWDQKHFVVLYSASARSGRGRVKIADPAVGFISYTKKEFLDHWISSVGAMGEKTGTILLFEPDSSVVKRQEDNEVSLKWGQIFSYLRSSKLNFFQVGLSLLITSFIQLLFPFLAQSIIDRGVNNNNLDFIGVVLTGQFVLICSQSIADFMRSRFLLGISSDINLSILSEFWKKLTRLPIYYFESHHTGDTLQRLDDHKRIELFLTRSGINTLFSFLNFVVFSIVLVRYNTVVFAIFIAGSLVYFLWVYLFLNIHRKINYQVFNMSSKENNATLQLVQGMQEIRLHGAEKVKRSEWEQIKCGIFRLNFKGLTYTQIEQAGSLVINQGKNLALTFLVASLVIQHKLTLGTMLAIQYIVGQLNGPLEQFHTFLQHAQDAKISMERLNEIHRLDDEEAPSDLWVKKLPSDKSIQFRNLSFSYPGTNNQEVIKGITIEIPEKKVTAIVGVSGSGKTTMLKLLLKYFEHYSGEIRIGGCNFRNLSPSFWRAQCSVVLQDGFIFNDSIAGNIAVGGTIIDQKRLMESASAANIISFIQSLPNGFQTRIGMDGMSISQGQKQRILIARALYKRPEYFFFDEATNSLDANNEKLIVENLQEIFHDKTVIVVAHRLSTVKNADKIIVLFEGKVAESGTHDELVSERGRYFELVRNQLEIGS